MWWSAFSSRVEMTRQHKCGLTEGGRKEGIACLVYCRPLAGTGAIGQCIGMKSCLSVLTLALSLFISPASAEILSGQADIVDGDTLSIQGEKTRIRLYGVDAPEGQQTC